MLEKDEFHPRYEWCYDYAHPEVREDKLNVLREIMSDYEADGVELDFMFVPKFFKTGEEEKHAQAMTDFVGDVGRMADEIGEAQGRKVVVSARVLPPERANLRLGLDVETCWQTAVSIWSSARCLSSFMDTGAFDVGWMVDAAQSSDTGTLRRPTRRVYDERTPVPELEMYRAFAQTARRQEPTDCILAISDGRSARSSTTSCAKWPTRTPLPDVISATYFNPASRGSSSKSLSTTRAATLRTPQDGR